MFIKFGNFVFNFSKFALRRVVVTKPLVSGILYSTSTVFVLRTVVVPKALHLDIFFFNLY